MDRKTKILNFEFSTSAERQIFFKKMSDLYGWPETFCERALIEYKRFICLAATSGERVVPSRIVDNVWHMHLTFTKSYWHDLCRDRVGKDIHHNPSQTDAESKARDLNGYLNTLNLYRTTFGAKPAHDFWPEPGAYAQKTRNRKLWLPMIGSTALLAACSTLSDFDGSMLFPGFIALIVLLMIINSLRSGGDKKKKRGKRRRGSSGAATGGGCSDCSSCSSCSSCGGGGD
ncbi:glycine-rich domain-containing protein [Microbulbifer rhizosphaerae]|uniref:Uncharacterized protein n=1 Tax=Microbulbifer rhizosphaerae TaxID=1562603 RepID=A0A7W4ZB68_9GAMM|nr:hypothetical protein [Microbulbifer rhizosphaerae]MBB3063311.1 hypothetical protein [Microbulbifer rhizosphaerae]